LCHMSFPFMFIYTSKCFKPQYRLGQELDNVHWVQRETSLHEVIQKFQQQ
jgi:hypothetical protein